MMSSGANSYPKETNGFFWKLSVDKRNPQGIMHSEVEEKDFTTVQSQGVAETEGTVLQPFLMEDTGSGVTSMTTSQTPGLSRHGGCCSSLSIYNDYVLSNYSYEKIQ